MNSICLAYSAVHQIFQLALAAHEMGELDGLFCTMVDRPGKLGATFSRFMPVVSARPMGFDQLPADRLMEFPWPVLLSRALMRLMPWKRRRHVWSNAWFDFRAAHWLRSRNARIFVGAETCAVRSLREAKRQGMITVLDCPGIPSPFLDRYAQRAAEEFRLSVTPATDPVMHKRKLAEIALADVVLGCSDLQASLLVAEGLVAQDKIRAIPLWTDVDYWSARPRDPFSALSDKLRVLYAGAVSLKKGVPYLLRAMEEIGGKATLTLVGAISRELTQMIKAAAGHTHLSYVSKDRLRELYGSHDVLVMPTLGDSFGFVVLEAMAAGLPVIVSDHCGAPVPNETWRVPALNAHAIAERLRHYAADRDALRRDSKIAHEFAAQFRPEKYRAEAGRLFQELLTTTAPHPNPLPNGERGQQAARSTL